MEKEIRAILATMLAESHLAQAKSLKKRMNLNTYMDRSSKEVLWATYFSHLDAAQTLLQRADNV